MVHVVSSYLLYRLLCQLHDFCCHFPTLVFDLCEIDNGGCEHNCTNIGDSYYCTCNTGYQLNSDGTTCQEIISSMYIIIYVLPNHVLLNSFNIQNCEVV